jgi:hypothetical protein
MTYCGSTLEIGGGRQRGSGHHTRSNVSSHGYCWRQEGRANPTQVTISSPTECDCNKACGSNTNHGSQCLLLRKCHCDLAFSKHATEVLVEHEKFAVPAWPPRQQNTDVLEWCGIPRPPLTTDCTSHPTRHALNQATAGEQRKDRTFGVPYTRGRCKTMVVSPL